MTSTSLAKPAFKSWLVSTRSAKWLQVLNDRPSTSAILLLDQILSVVNHSLSVLLRQFFYWWIVSVLFFFIPCVRGLTSWWKLLTTETGLILLLEFVCNHLKLLNSLVLLSSLVLISRWTKRFLWESCMFICLSSFLLGATSSPLPSELKRKHHVFDPLLSLSFFLLKLQSLLLLLLLNF